VHVCVCAYACVHAQKGSENVDVVAQGSRGKHWLVFNQEWVASSAVLDLHSLALICSPPSIDLALIVH